MWNSGTLKYFNRLDFLSVLGWALNEICSMYSAWDILDGCILNTSTKGFCLQFFFLKPDSLVRSCRSLFHTHRHKKKITFPLHIQASVYVAGQPGFSLMLKHVSAFTTLMR